MVILKIDRSIFQICRSYNHEGTLHKVYSTYQKIAQIKEVFKNITNHAKRNLFSQQTLIYLHLIPDSENIFFKNQDIHNT